MFRAADLFCWNCQKNRGHRPPIFFDLLIEPFSYRFSIDLYSSLVERAGLDCWSEETNNPAPALNPSLDHDVLVVRLGALGKAGPAPRKAPGGPPAQAMCSGGAGPSPMGPPQPERWRGGTSASSRGLPSSPGGRRHQTSAVPFRYMPPAPQNRYSRRAAVSNRPRRDARRR